MARQEDALDFQSKDFNPVKALSVTDVQLPVSDAKEYEDLDSLRKDVHGQRFNVVREIPGVLGPGGIPKPNVRKIPVGRNFTPEQGLIKGRGPRRRRNVITRMEEMIGPLAVLRKCQEENIRVKSWSSSASLSAIYCISKQIMRKTHPPSWCS
ncbi:uncharacterized protein [Procambarus clarkii]|uniref:uncharacterized protein n=1 Tax=Procambarus clarkii TaxID=6728 RepID=UPI003742E71A